MIYPLNLSKAREFVLDLMPRAGQVLRSHFHSFKLSKTKKGKLDFVTEADLQVDEFLRHELSEEFPGVRILTEETAPKNISEFVTDDLLWIVDPLDGTANFARGDDNFSISIALVYKKQPILGVVFAPTQSRLFWAQDDKEYSYWNGRKIRVSTVEEISEATICTDWSHIVETREQTTDFLRLVYWHARQIKILGSAATDLTLLARGGVDIYHHVYLFPWDSSASAIIARKAGAVISDIRGGEWNCFTPSILASNPVLHRKILTLLRQKAPSQTRR